MKQTRRSMLKKGVIAAGMTGLGLPLADGTGESKGKDIRVDVSRVLSDVSHNPVGMNVCWMTDSDEQHPARVRDFDQAVGYLGLGSLRFPAGGLADHYLWTTPPYDPEDGLEPRAAAPSRFVEKSNWSRYVNPDGTFRGDMDFDEFMGVCQEAGVEPVIMVNLLSYLSEEGPTLEELKRSAVEWVRYANVKRKYNVKYWEIGNEVEGKYGRNVDEYIRIFLDFRKGMKAVDPSIRLGFGAHTWDLWFNTMVQKHPDKVDFLIAHPYVNDFEKYSDYLHAKESNRLIDRVERAVRSIRRYAPPQHRRRIKVLATEASSFSFRGKWKNRDNNILKAMVYFEMVGNMSVLPEVDYFHFWTAHSPWTPTDATTDDKALDWQNRVLPVGFVSKVWTDFLQKNMVYATRARGFVRAYSSYSPETKALAVYLLNKNHRSEKITVALDGYDGSKAHEMWTLRGINGRPDDTEYLWQKTDSVEVSPHSFAATLPPCSISVVAFGRARLDHREILA